jgi:acyl-CoA thioesterase I
MLVEVLRHSRRGLLMRARRLFAASVSVLATACGGSPSDATISDDQATIVSTSRRTEYLAAGIESATQPAVLIRDRELHALGGRQVRFVIVPDSGQMTEVSLKSDSAGRAALRGARFPTAGHYRVDAHFGATNLIQFSVLALPAALLTPTANDRCPLLDDTLPQFGGIPHTAALLRGQQPITIVALGSSSTFGTGASDSSLSFPSQFARQLSRVFPGSAIRLFNAGVGGNVATDMDARLDGDVLVHAPDLVVLQTGTNDARNSVPIDTMRAATRRTIRRIREHGGEIIILDSQRFQGDGETPQFLTYLSALTDVATELSVPVARRYGWMSAALAANKYTYAELIGPDHLHQTDLASECTAHLLSTGIAAAVYSGQH